MSGDPRIDILSNVSTIVGAASTAAGFVGTWAVTKGPYSTKTYVNSGNQKLRQAEALMYQKHEQGELEEYIVPEQERTEFRKQKLDALIDEGQDLKKTIGTFPRAVLDWNTARGFYYNACQSTEEAEGLSENSLRNYRKRKDALERQARQLRESQGLQNESAQIGRYSHLPENEAVSQYISDSTSMGQGGPAGYNSQCDTRGRNHTTATSQQSFSTARAESPTLSQRYTSRNMCQSPESLEGPSFANEQGYLPSSRSCRRIQDNSNRV